MKETENKGKVYVIQEVSKFNVISAREYGDLMTLNVVRHFWLSELRYSIFASSQSRPAFTERYALAGDLSVARKPATTFLHALPGRAPTHLADATTPEATHRNGMTMQRVTARLFFATPKLNPILSLISMPSRIHEKRF